MSVSLLIVLFGMAFNLCEAYHSCKDLKKANPSVLNGEYEMYNGAGGKYKTYCEFYGTYGYQFISKSATTFLQNALNLISPSTTQVLVRHMRSNGNQYDTIMTQISTKSNIPISIQYNQNVNYATPQNYATLAPYLYLGFLPINEAKQFSTQGYRANSKDFTFGNCDANPNSYLAFFFNVNKGQPTDYHNRCCYTKLMRDWIDVAGAASNNLPCDYFYNFEMHMGGCGGYAINGYSSLQDITGAAVGMRFEL